MVGGTNGDGPVMTGGKNGEGLVMEREGSRKIKPGPRMVVYYGSKRRSESSASLKFPRGRSAKAKNSRCTRVLPNRNRHILSRTSAIP